MGGRSSSSCSSESESDSSDSTLSSMASETRTAPSGGGGSNRDKIKRSLSWRSAMNLVRKEKDGNGGGSGRAGKEEKRAGGDSVREKDSSSRRKLTAKIFKTEKEMKEGKMENLRKAGEVAYEHISSLLTEIERTIEKKHKVDERLTEKVCRRSSFLLSVFGG